MNKLLEKAIQMYPIGTKCRSMKDGAEHIVSKNAFIYYENIYTFDEQGGIRCIYHKAQNKWAEIIKEQEITPLKLLNSKAECIFHISKNGDVILRGKVIANDIELSEILTNLNTNTMTQQEFKDLRELDMLDNLQIVHKYKDLVIAEGPDGFDLLDLAKINKLNLKLQPKTFMGLEIKKYDNVPCEMDSNQLYYLVEVRENSILVTRQKNSTQYFTDSPTSIRIL